MQKRIVKNHKQGNAGRGLGAMLRPSFFLCLTWWGIALLHLWLLVRRLWLLEGNAWLMQLVYCVLCALAVVYCSLKIRRVTTVFDASPRRALIFGLMLYLGHSFISSPNIPQDAHDHAQPLPAAVLVVAAPMLVLFAALVLRRVSSGAGYCATLVAPVMTRLHQLDRDFKVLFYRFYPPLWHLPPPRTV